MSSKTAGEFPKGLAVKLGEMDKNLKKLEQSLDPILSTPIEESYPSVSFVNVTQCFQFYVFCVMA